VQVEGGHLSVTSARCLRSGDKHAWLEIVLHEGRNRQIRRLLAALGVGVLRLVRIAVGSLRLGDLPKGKWRMLDAAETEALLAPGRGNGTPG
jgi:23S rRNA pseudouridine2605 synthase